MTGPNGEAVEYDVIDGWESGVTTPAQYTDDELDNAPGYVRLALAELGVHASSGGEPMSVFRFQGGGRWREVPTRPASEGGAATDGYDFTEVTRNEWSITVEDRSRGYTIELDLRSGVVKIRTADSEYSPLYEIARIGE